MTEKTKVSPVEKRLRKLEKEVKDMKVELGVYKRFTELLISTFPKSIFMKDEKLRIKYFEVTGK